MINRILLSCILLPILLTGCSSNDEVKGIKPESGDVIKDLGPNAYMGNGSQVNCTKQTIKNTEVINQFLNIDDYIKEVINQSPDAKGWESTLEYAIELIFDMYCLDE